MSDPAVEAADRMAHGSRSVSVTLPSDREIAAAREALRPIKSMWRKHIGNDKITYHQRCHAIATDLVKLIFNDDELEGYTGE